jgi:hypothetical protein
MLAPGGIIPFLQKDICYLSRFWRQIKLRTGLLLSFLLILSQVLAAQALDFEIAAKSSGTVASPTPSRQEAPADVTSKTVVDMTTSELRIFYRNELRFLKFTESQDLLDSLLKQAGDRVIAFFRDFSNTSSKELVVMSRENGDDLSLVDASHSAKSGMIPTLGTGYVSRVAEYQYLILPGSGNTGASWVEDRVDKKNRPLNREELQGFTMSSGHVGKCIYLHPSRQANSYFRYLGRETKKPGAHVIAFAQKPEARDYWAQYTDADSSTPIRFLVQGFVWLDPDSFQILRMRTSMLLPERQTLLKETISDIRYGKFQFDNPLREFWLPKEIDVSWEFLQANRDDLIYRCHHQYSDYHFFTVDTNYKIAQPKDSK